MARRPLFGPVRKQIYDTAATAQNSVSRITNEGHRSIVHLSASALKLLGKFTEVADEILDGAEVEVEANVMGKTIPIKLKLKLNLREEEDNES